MAAATTVVLIYEDYENEFGFVKRHVGTLFLYFFLFCIFFKRALLRYILLLFIFLQEIAAILLASSTTQANLERGSVISSPR